MELTMPDKFWTRSELIGDKSLEAFDALVANSHTGLSARGLAIAIEVSPWRARRILKDWDGRDVVVQTGGRSKRFGDPLFKLNSANKFVVALARGLATYTLEVGRY